MKELIFNPKYDNNLLSIGFFIPTDDDRLVLSQIFTSLHELTGGWVHIIGSYPNYDVKDIRIESMKSESLMTNAVITNSEFVFHASTFDQGLVHVISKLWYAYEQFTCCFFKPGFEQKLSGQDSWIDITEITLAFVAFKSAEQDILWIGKSPILQFPEFIFERA